MIIENLEVSKIAKPQVLAFTFKTSTLKSFGFLSQILVVVYAFSVFTL